MEPRSGETPEQASAADEPTGEGDPRRQHDRLVRPLDPRVRCRVLALVLAAVLLVLTLGLWRLSVHFLEENQQRELEQYAGLAGTQLRDYLERHLETLESISHFCALHPELTQERFEAFCELVLRDTPGIVAVMVSGTEGVPQWTAPPMNVVDRRQMVLLTATPESRGTLERAKVQARPVLTPPLEIPVYGAGLMGVAKVEIRGQLGGYAMGVMPYRNLAESLLAPGQLRSFRLGIAHGGQGIMPATPEGATIADGDGPSVTETLIIGRQQWDLTVRADPSHVISALNFVSLTILALGLTLSLLTAFLVYRWQLRAALAQSEASAHRSRLVDTGLSLLELKGEFDLILGSVDEGVIFYDDHLNPVQANGAFLNLFNMTREDLAMRDGSVHHEALIQFFGSETRYWSLFGALNTDPVPTYSDEIEARRPETRAEGRRRPGPRIFMRRAASLASADGRGPRGALVIYKDLTTIKHIEAVKDEFLSNVTHELRSPLASIKGFAETMRRDREMPEETREEFVSIICEETERLQNLIEELLDMRRMEAHGMSMRVVTYDMKVLVDDVVKSSRSIVLGSGITFDVSMTGNPDTQLQGDPGLITRALRNLVVNAVKYSPKNGLVRVEVESLDHAIAVQISDQGPGINEADLPRIFDKFYRGKSQGRQKGTGLGLAIVKHTIEMHGGHLGVRSEEGRGTTFHMELPRHFEPAVPVESAAGGGAGEAG